MKQTQTFTEGKIFSPLIRFALPVLFALFLQTMYGAIDLLVVGQFGGDFAVRLPVSWFISRQAGVSLFHIGLATPASSLIQIILCIVYFLFITYRERNLDRKC